MAHLLGAEQIDLEFPTKQVFDGITVGVNEGDRIGIVGRNGDGKSTLLKILSKQLEPDSGRVTYRGSLRVGYLTQVDKIDNSLSIGQAVVGEGPEHEWATDPKIRDVLQGLLGDLDWSQQVGTLSGGQRRRVALAALLAGDYDIVMLDEPTNHLDVEAVAWLAEHLRNRWSKTAGGLLVVTHDRWFLDAVCNLTWEVYGGKIEPFDGGYAAYVLQRAERNRQAASSEARRQNLLRKELAWLGRGAPARTAKPKFRIDAALNLIANEPPPRDQLELSKLATQRLGKDVVDFEDVSYQTEDGKPILKDVTWRLGPGDRIGLLGANGAGKTTLLQLMTGELRPGSGRIKIGKTVKFATLSQDVRELDEFADDRIFAMIKREKTTFTVGKKEVGTGQLVEQLGFDSAQLQTPISELSGGQRRRFQLLRLLFTEPNVLILDEPTNDLDTDMLAAVEDLLDTWPGTLIVVSHDRYLLERVTDQQFALLGDGKLRHLPKGVEQFLQLRKAQPQVQTVVTVAKPQSALSGAEKRNLEKESARLERAMAKGNLELEQILLQLATADQADYELLLKLAERQRELTSQLGEFETLWLETLEKLQL
ncbi:MAG: ATP-binding cassette domain-containing protein [Aquiluna sp.]|nr:ATP-binding cassette domain-containing protein [Aquiluna sp.]